MFGDQDDVLGSIYFIRVTQWEGPIKIGFTQGDPLDRMRDLQVGCPWPLEFLGSVPGTRRDEASLHTKFGTNNRTNGEWFSPTPSVWLPIMRILRDGFISHDRAWAA